ncbi:hypothetical protein [Halomonas sp. Mc5H-6]|uniref:hypothetical protein n=1 Tax=Halomonas sp. Mc5H-6 TaxID=2954500 RepID=UPI002097C2B6|nr:hypothetical protein [Halomonas sp. Mc5H-6]
MSDSNLTQRGTWTPLSPLRCPKATGALCVSASGATVGVHIIRKPSLDQRLVGHPLVSFDFDPIKQGFRRRPLHYALGSISWARMLQALGGRLIGELDVY